jgi:hypothetical protein
VHVIGFFKDDLSYDCAEEVTREHEVARLAVHVIKGDRLWPGGRQADTQAHVTVFQRDGSVAFKTRSRSARAEEAPEWSLISVIDLLDEEPLDCCISLQVKMLPPFSLGFRKTICAYYAPLRSLLNSAHASVVVGSQVRALSAAEMLRRW